MKFLPGASWNQFPEKCFLEGRGLIFPAGYREREQHIPTVVLTSFQLFNQPSPPSEIELSFTKAISVHEGNYAVVQSVGIYHRFAALIYFSRENSMLINWKLWQELELHRYQAWATYTNLDPGIIFQGKVRTTMDLEWAAYV